MASFPNVRPTRLPSDLSEGIRMLRVPLAVATLVVALGTVFALSELATHRGGRTVHTTPKFLTRALGAPRPKASLVRTQAHGTATTIGRSGYAVSNSIGTVRVTQPDTTSRTWVHFANGTSRRTSYGSEAIVLGGKRANAEQYLTVGKHNGERTWTWRLSVGSLTPTLRPDGSVLISPAHVVAGFSILPLAIFDKRGKNVTPRGAAWGLVHKSGSWWLTLAIDDSKLPIPYVIDPATETYRAANSAGNAGATTVVITKPAGLAQNDLMLAQITTRGGTNVAVCAPAATGAWTSLRSDNSTTVLQQDLFYKVATAADVAATNYTFTIGTGAGCATTSSQKASGGIAAFYGINDASPINANSGLVNASSTTITTTAINNGTIGNFLVGAYGIANAEAVTQPGGVPTFTERWDTGSTAGFANTRTESEFATAVTTATGSTGAKNATVTTAAVNIGQLVTLALDTVAPTNALTATSASPAGSSYINGTSLYYNGNVAGSFQLQDAVTETGSGVTSVQFPALGGTTTGWSHTADTETTPVGGPYVTTNNFSWNAGTSSGPTEAVLATDNATNATTTTLNFINDSTAPNAFSITAPGDGATIANGQAVSAAPTDGGSGIAQVEFRYCAGWTCTFASGTSIGIDTTSPYSVNWSGSRRTARTRSSPAATDNVGNTTDSSPVTVTVSNAAAAPPTVDIATKTTASIGKRDDALVVADGRLAVEPHPARHRLRGVVCVLLDDERHVRRHPADQDRRRDDDPGERRRQPRLREHVVPAEPADRYGHGRRDADAQHDNGALGRGRRHLQRQAGRSGREHHEPERERPGLRNPLDDRAELARRRRLFEREHPRRSRTGRSADPDLERGRERDRVLGDELQDRRRRRARRRCRGRTPARTAA